MEKAQTDCLVVEKEKVDKSENDVDIWSELFFERRLICRQSLFIIHNEVQSASCVEFYFDCSNFDFAELEFLVHLVRLQIVEFIKQVSIYHSNLIATVPKD